jgi:hypothetical protein
MKEHAPKPATPAELRALDALVILGVRRLAEKKAKEATK